MTETTVDTRRWFMEATIDATNRDGSTRTYTAQIEVKPYFSRALAPVINLLWLDAGPFLPWTPSAINEVVLNRDHDTITYKRA